jgi:hypothetical protein
MKNKRTRWDLLIGTQRPLKISKIKKNIANLIIYASQNLTFTLVTESPVKVYKIASQESKIKTYIRHCSE